MSPYLCTWVAITLDLDPATVIADIESQHEKNPQRAEFWRSFLARAAMWAVVACTLALSGLGGSGTAPGGAGGFRRRLRCA
ncbi:MAG: hypothetical protein M0P39_06805 [Rhodocyclaceae bacterium]|nr:hypothetical protein [Rhodocyclaceae bacterium]